MKNNNILYVLGSFFVIGYLLFIAKVPQSYLSFTDFGFADTLSYLAITHENSFSRLRELSSSYPFHHLERWPIHLLTGVLAVLFKVNDLVVYRAITLLFMIICMCLISTINTSSINKLAYFAFIVLNPYAFMISLFAPPMVSDCVFITAIVALVVGLINQKYKYIWLALFFGLISRQTSIMILPIVVGAAYFLPSLRKELPQFLLGSSVLFIAFNLLTKALFGQNPNDLTLNLITGLYSWLKHPDQDSLLIFFGSLGAFLLTLGPLLLFKINRNYLGIAILGVVCIAFQPILSGPVITGGNAARLVAFSIPFIGLFFIDHVKSLALTFLFIGLLALNALHHNYSDLFSGFQKKHYFFILLTTFIISLLIRFNLVLNARKSVRV